MGKTNRGKNTCACFVTRKAARAVTQFYNNIIADEDLPASQHSLLSVAYHIAPISISRMAEITVMDRTTLTRNLKPLKEKNLIDIKPGEDRRERIIHITQKGIDKLKKTMRKWEQAQIELEKRLGSKKFDQYLEMLTEVSEKISE